MAALLLLAALLLGAYPSGAAPSQERGAPQSTCNGLKDLPRSKVPLCTHGGDLASQIGGGQAINEGTATSSAGTAPCLNGGSSGARVEVIYGVPKDRTNNYRDSLSAIRKVIANADYQLDASSPGAGQHYRWMCANGTKVTISNVTLMAVGPDGQFTFEDMVYSLQKQVQLRLGARDYISPARSYLVFVDHISDVNGWAGYASIDNDDRPDASVNANNVGPAYAMINKWTANIAEHELGHNLGAVQLSAPHSTGGWHCYFEYDAMCYKDASPYTDGGGALVYSCPSSPAWQFDCLGDDYYSTAPLPGSYLAGHWNSVNSAFLTRP